MAEATKIEWADSTFNPVIGCQHVSPGCEHCYAENLANRYGWAKWGVGAERKRTTDAYWRQPMQWQLNASKFQFQHKRRQRVFCASLSDWLDNKWDRQWRADLCELIEATPALDWLMLTKRPSNFFKLAPKRWQEQCPANVWFGVTTEDEKHYRARWPIVQRIDAVVRFISYEPAIGPLGNLHLGGPVPDWIIVGGESGNGARVMRPHWAREVRDQYSGALFVKQWGTYASNPIVVEQRQSRSTAERLDPPTNGKGGALLDGRLHRAFPR